jgi:hypothetical protein
MLRAALTNSVALLTRPFSYFETRQPFRAADAAFATGLSAYARGAAQALFSISGNIRARAKLVSRLASHFEGQDMEPGGDIVL